MKLIVDNTNIETIPVGNLMDIGEMARRFAEDVDTGQIGDVVSVTLLIETNEGLMRETWGEIPTGYELIGMLETVKLGVLRDDTNEDQ